MIEEIGWPVDDLGIKLDRVPLRLWERYHSLMSGIWKKVERGVCENDKDALNELLPLMRMNAEYGASAGLPCPSRDKPGLIEKRERIVGLLSKLGIALVAWPSCTIELKEWMRERTIEVHSALDAMNVVIDEWKQLL